MTLQWIRGNNPNAAFGRTFFAVAALNAGETIRRVLFGIQGNGFFTSAPSSQSDLNLVLANATSFGWVTTIGNGSETPPSPLLSPGNAAPPEQRWLFVATQANQLLDFSGSSSTWPIGFKEPFYNVETEAQVKAPNMAAGNTLNLWFSIDVAVTPWNPQTPSDLAWWSIWWSVLVNRLP